MLRTVAKKDVPIFSLCDIYEKTTNYYRYLRNKYILKNELRRPLGRKVAECFRGGITLFRIRSGLLP